MTKRQPAPKEITTRDVLALRSLARYRYLTTTQLVTLHFPSAQMAMRRIRDVLVPAGYVSRFRPRAVPGHGSTEYIHHLTAAGAELVAGSLGCDVSAIAYPKKKRQQRHGWRMDHMLGIVQFWLSLDLAAQDSDVRVHSFVPEWQRATQSSTLVSATRDQTPNADRPSEIMTLQPDAAFVLERAGKKALFFLEVDRQTETVTSATWPDFTDKIHKYKSYRAHGGFRRYGEFQGFRTLITTLSMPRVGSYREAAHAAGTSRMFLVTLATLIKPEAILNPIWWIPNPDDNRLRAIVGSP